MRSADEDIRLRARATCARRLIREGRLDPDLGLSLVVWPTPLMLRAEALCPVETLRGRAWRDAA